MKQYLFGLGFGLFSLALTAPQMLFAQQKKDPIKAPAFVEKSDPEATKTLNKLRDKFQKYPALSGDFVLTIEGGKNKETQQGKIAQKGDKYRIINGGNELICDGKTIWMYQKTGANANSVQINDFDPADEDMLAPNNLFKLYEQENKFFYAITNEVGTLQEIEFKPLDKKSEYNKIRLKVDKLKLEIKEVKVFGKDGMRYTLVLNNLGSANLEDSYFRFDKSKYPGVKVNDLRD